MNQSTKTDDVKTTLRDQAIAEFVKSGASYYKQQFDRLDESAHPILSINAAAAILGPIWWGARHLWLYFWIFLFFECIALIQIFRGLFADLGIEEYSRAQRLSKMAEVRRGEAEDAMASGADNANVLHESASALQAASHKAFEQADQIAAQAPLLATLGISAIVVLKLVQGLIANRLLKTRFQQWRADQTLSSGIDLTQTISMAIFFLLVMVISTYRFTASNVPDWLKQVPVDMDWRRSAETQVDNAVQWLTESFSVLFGGITLAIRQVLDFLETIMVGTPWVVVMAAIVLVAAKAAGTRVAIYTAAALFYLGFFGFWEKSMLTVALLGTACLICLVIGIPLGILCQRRTRVRSVVWPVLDLMQTMPSFVYLIPVIAFFGIGKPPGIIATIIFGMPPVVRLTVLGLEGVPEHIREAAKAFGASRLYLLLRVDLPLAKPSIMTGVNQTILMCLSMVVIASLIGAKGLGEDVLDALTYAHEGKGILAGIAILFCAMILDRIVQSKKL